MPPVFQTVLHMLAENASSRPQAEALVCGSERLSYSEYARCVAGFASQLRDAGAGGGRVAVILGNSVDICIAVLAAQAAGAQVATLNPLLTEHELTPLLEDIDAVAVVHDVSLTPLLSPLLERLGVPCRVVVGTGASSLSQWRAVPQRASTDSFPMPGSRALLLYTGGTTGIPKGVELSHSACTHGVAQLNSLIPTRPGAERLLCAMPLCHVYTLMVGMLNMLYCGGSLVILPRYAPTAVLDALAAESITLLAGGPTMFAGLLADPGLSARHFRHLRCSYSGSSALPEETLRRWERASGAPVLEGYGQTETGGGIVFNPLDGVRKVGSVGVPMAGVEIEIVDATTGTVVLPAGETGEIRVRGPQLMTGYRGRPMESAAVLRDGWLYTTDIGHLDSDGYLYISDRKKDMVIVSGFNVYPREVEEVLYKHPDVFEAAVVGVPDAYQGEALRAYIVLRSSGARDADAISRHCRAHLAGYKVPRQIVFADALPKTSVGKIDKKRLGRIADA